MERLPTALELFERFLPKHNIITLEPRCWSNEHPNRFYLALCRDGQELRGYTYRGSPYAWLNFAETGLPLSFCFDPNQGKSAQEQFDVAGGAEIRKFLAARIFRLVPADPIAKLETQNGWSKINIQIAVEGDPVPGLFLPSGENGNQIHAGWNTFIPSDTPEARAILARIRYEYVHEKRPADLAKELRERQCSCKQELEAALLEVT